MPAKFTPSHRFGLASGESRDAAGYAITALRHLAGSRLLDRLGARKPLESWVAKTTSTTFSAALTTQRALRSFTRRGTQAAGVRPTAGSTATDFDLTPTEDEAMLVEVAADFASEVLRPAAAAANDSCVAPVDVTHGAREIGLHLLGVPESLGGISEERSAMATALVLEALAKADMGLAVAAMSSGAAATALALWGSDQQQQTYLSTLSAEQSPATGCLALAEPTVLFDAMRPQASATSTASGFVLNGEKSLVPGAASADLLVVGAELDGVGRLFVIETATEGVHLAAEPAMGVRASATTRVTLQNVAVDQIALLGSEADYRECVRLSRLAWCALAVGTSQAVLDYVTPYVKEREAFGEPIAHRQAVAFMVANIAIEVEAMRLLTYRAAARVSRGKDATREIALARRLCADKGIQIGSDGVQLLGGHGFVKEHPVERWYRDLRAIGVMEGGVLI